MPLADQDKSDALPPPTSGALPSSPQVLPKRSLVEFAFLVLVLAPLLRYGSSPFLGTFSVVFASIVLEALPFLLIGSLASGFLDEFASQGRIARLLFEGKARTPFVAAALGLLFPVCECAIVPVVRRLMKKGMPLSASVAFLLGGPIVNPIVFVSTAVAYGLDWEVALIRVILGYFIAVLVGFIVGCVFGRRRALFSHEGPLPCPEKAVENHPHIHASYGRRTGAALVHGAEDFLDMSSFLVIGASMAALVQSTVDRSIFYSLSGNPLLGIILMMLLAMALSICSEADAFVAASFQLSLPLSAQMAFMVLGPMLDLKLLFMYLGLFRKKTIAFLGGTTFFAVLGIMMLFQSFVQWVLS
jgi:uncharacterized membrane protein YraQ (UPF0718 family)